MDNLLDIIYICASTYSHFGSSRVLDIFKQLRNEGHNITISSGLSLKDIVTKKGFDFFNDQSPPVKNQEEHESIEEINAIQMSTNYLNPKNTIKTYKQTKDFIQKKGFDIILSDNLSWISPWLGEKLNIPYVVISYQKFILPPPIAKSFEKPVEMYIQGVTDFIQDENLHPILPSSISPVGIAPSKFLNILYSSPSFEGKVDGNSAYLGGTKIEKDLDYENELKNTLYYKNGKNVYYSSGTIFWDEHQVKDVIQLGKDYKINLFISEGNLFKIKQETPDNIEVCSWYDPKTLDKLVPCMDLVIAQGGLGLTTRTIRSGVPLLIAPVMPGNFPQSVRVNNYGNGIGLLNNHLTLEEAFKELAYENNKKYKSKAIQLQEEFNQLGGTSKAVELIKDTAYSHSL